ncbi:MAG: AraC family transcriptional regulator [Phenylobacterium sp.]|nr:AraC family transcriptional regulator [Phenylobacterium sp.]
MLIPTFVFDVADLPEDQQFAAWAAHVANSRPSRPVDHGPFRARAQFWQMDPLVISEQWMDAFTFDRDEAMVRATPTDRYQLVVVLEGRLRFVRPEGDVYCEAGGCVFSDLTRTELMHAEPAHTIMVHIARWFLDEALAPRDAHGPLPDTPAVRLLAEVTTALVRRLPEIPAASALTMARVLRDVLATALTDLPPRPNEDARAPLRQRVRAHIEREPMGEVSVEGICHSLGVTRSSLNRAFKAEGGVLAYDRRRRLMALHSRLADPGEVRSIGELGFDYGFPEKAHLTRAFRAAFGYPPSVVRSQAALMAPPTAEPGSLQAIYKAALKRL